MLGGWIYWKCYWAVGVITGREGSVETSEGEGKGGFMGEWK